MEHFIIIDMQGYKGENNKFILKEIAISCDKNENYHYLIKSPYSFCNLSKELQKQANWLYKYHHNLHWNLKGVSINMLKNNYSIYLQDKKIYVKNHEKREWVIDLFKNITPNLVFDLDDFGCTNIENLKKQFPNIMQCSYHKDKNYRCALQNVILYRHYVEKNLK